MPLYKVTFDACSIPMRTRVVYIKAIAADHAWHKCFELYGDEVFGILNVQPAPWYVVLWYRSLVALAWGAAAVAVVMFFAVWVKIFLNLLNK